MPVGNDPRATRPSTAAQPSLASVKQAASPSIKHLGRGDYVLIEAQHGQEPVCAIAWTALGYERVIARVDTDHDLLDAISSQPKVKVARCSKRGEPTSDYIICTATLIPPDQASNAGFMLNMSYGVLQRLANRAKRSKYTPLELLPVKTRGRPLTAVAATAIHTATVSGPAGRRRRHAAPPGAADTA